VQQHAFVAPCHLEQSAQQLLNVFLRPAGCRGRAPLAAAAGAAGHGPARAHPRLNWKVQPNPAASTSMPRAARPRWGAQAAGGRQARAETAALRSDLGGLQTQLAGAAQELDAERSASAPRLPPPAPRCPLGPACTLRASVHEPTRTRSRC